MQEIYVVSSAETLTIVPYSGQYGIDKGLIEILKSDNLMELMPVSAQGDPDLIRSSVFELRDGSGGGVVIIYNGNMEPVFCVIARRRNELAHLSAHFAEVVSSIRDGKNIFECKTGQAG